MKREYRRHLPHQIPEGVPIFLTWNLKGALPKEATQRLQCRRKELEIEPRRQNESDYERAIRHGKLMFAETDDCLDNCSVGPLYLKDADCAKIIEEAILFGVAVRYQLYAWCVMANHVHVLLTPLWKLSEITQGLKGFTARRINELQRQSGRVFWQDESYDHWVRDEEELLRIIHYIENNPVKAGLCAQSADWPWSSARFRHGWPLAEPFKRSMLSRSGFLA